MSVEGVRLFSVFAFHICSVFFFPLKFIYISSSFANLENENDFPDTIFGINIWIIVGVGGGMFVNTQIYYTYIHTRVYYK